MSINIKSAVGQQQQGEAVVAFFLESKILPFCSAELIGLRQPPANFAGGRCVTTHPSVVLLFFVLQPASQNAASRRAAHPIISAWQRVGKFTQSGIFKDIAAAELVMAPTMARRTSVGGSALINEVFIITRFPLSSPFHSHHHCHTLLVFFSPSTVRLRRLCVS